MTTIATADLHFSDNPRDGYRWLFLEQTLPALIGEHGARRVVICGDLTEAKDAHRAALVNRIVDGVGALAELADVIFLKGNHDYVAADVPFYRFLRHLGRVRWINEPARMRLRGLGECAFLPHDRDWRRAWGAEWTRGADVYFIHQTFRGADLGRGHLAGGEAPPFARGSRVVAGDVHVPQKVGPITYVGAPYRVDFGDDFEPRVLLLDGQEVRSIPVPGPQKHLVRVTGGWDEAGMQLHQELFRMLAPGDVVKVRVELAPGSEQSRAEVAAAVHAWAEHAGVQLYSTQVVPPPAARSSKAASRRSARSDEDLVRAYAKKMRRGRATVAAGLKIVEEIA